MSDLEEYPYEDSIDEKVLEFQLNVRLLSDSKKYIWHNFERNEIEDKIEEFQ